MLDRSFPAHEELRALLRRLADQPDAATAERSRHHLWRSPQPGDPNRGDHHALFGSRQRGAVLALIAHMRVATAADVQAAFGIREDMVRLALDTLVDADILVRERGRIRRTYRLREDARGADELRALLLRIGRCDRRIRAVANARVRGFAPQVRRAAIPERRAVAAEDRLPFLEAAHARMLLALLGGPRTVQEMSVAFALTPATVRTTAAHLEQTRVVQIERARRSTTVSLDASYPAHAELVALLATATNRDRTVVPIGGDYSAAPAFGNARVVRILVALARRAPTTADDIADRASANGGSAKRTLHQLARRRIVEIVDGNRYRFASTPIGRATEALVRRFDVRAPS
ncbi:MAG TPA: hypothetical protein VHT53_06105 [Candidatus Elarobacter sp.]|nr:hypothetical protein [Candidatus Elarobacter sp.]